MSEAKIFKAVVKGEVYIFSAVKLETVEKKALKLSESEANFKVTPLPHTDYSKVDFKKVPKLEGGAEDAAITPFVLESGDKREVLFATSKTAVERHAFELHKKECEFDISVLPVTEYSSTDWSKLVDLTGEDGDAPRKGRRKKEGTETTSGGDAGNKVDMSGVPGL
ncbi:hypothetical protein [Dickeya phage Sucellus]|nr:hypothetical protein [Dickeya phage Sucellus]